MASTHQKGNETIHSTPLGCLGYFVATIAGMLAGGYGAILIAMPFAPRLLAIQIGIVVGADVLAIGVIAYFARIYSAETKRHNPALKMACAFLAIGMLVFQGNGLALVISAGLANGFIGLGVWLWLLWPIPEPTQISC